MLNKFAFAGDWHGDASWARYVLAQFAIKEHKIVYQLGDFGIWPAGNWYLEEVNSALSDLDLELRVVPGNHEDWDQLDAMTNVDEYGFYYQWQFPRIKYAPRAHIWEHGGRNFASLSGAGSIDKEHRVPGVTWWPQEAVSDQAVTDLLRMVSDSDQPVDFFLSHETVNRHPLPKLDAPWITPEIEQYCHQSVENISLAVFTLEPKFMLHGHWHFFAEYDFFNTNIVSLDREASQFNAVEFFVIDDTYSILSVV